MSEKETFQGFINDLVDDNEKKHGREAREKYGNDAVERSDAKVRSMTSEQYAQAERLAKEYQACLKEAFEEGDPASDSAQKACELHRQWLCLFWDSYSKEAHIGVTRMYADDPRFSAYYDKIAPGCAVFLRDAVAVYCGRDV